MIANDDCENATTNNAPAQAQQRTCALYQRVKEMPDVIALNYCGKRSLPARQGVGLARKIGTDTALALHVKGKVAQPWIFQTDADAVLPATYFQHFSGEGARVFAHRHVVYPDVDNSDKLAHAAQLYDRHMRYYVDGLARAGSAYAFPTLGSTLALHAASYAKVRGYPRRNAAEDFYLLNKMAKIGSVIYEPDITLKLAARPSPRVPFGTGPALQAIVEQLQQDPSGAAYLSYHPASFDLLQTALAYMDQLARCSRVESASVKSCTDKRVESLLATLGFADLREQLHIRYTSAQQRHTVLQHWFDGFRTLRFIHEARRFFPDQPLVRSTAAFYGEVA